MNAQPVIYYQTDPRWRYNDYSAPGEKTTVGASGCGPSSMAMVLSTWCDKKVTPATECDWALKHGYKCPHSGTYYQYFVPAAKRYGLTCTRLNTASIYTNAKSPLHDQVKAAVQNGNLAIACMGQGNWTRSGHYVLVWWIDSNVIYINDPASSKAVRTRGDYSLFKKQVKYYWIIENPNKGKKEEPDMTEKEVRKIVKEELAEAAETLYNRLEDLPYGAETIYKLTQHNSLQGTSSGLALTEDLLRAIVIMDRELEFRLARSDPNGE